MSEQGGGSGSGHRPPPSPSQGRPWPPPTDSPVREGEARPRQPSVPAPIFQGQPTQRSTLPPPFQQPRQPLAPFAQPAAPPPQPAAPYQQQPAQELEQESQAASTMLGWEVARDPAWTQAPEQYAAPMAAGDSTTQQRLPTRSAAIALAVRRAARLSIDPTEVTDEEKAALDMASVTDPAVQGFLAWRRSVHLVAAIAIVPLLLLQLAHLVDSKGSPGALVALVVLQLMVDVSFAVLLWSQLKNWTQWHRQRRILAAGWLAFFLIPFLLYLYPLRSAMDDALAGDSGDPSVAGAGAVAFGLFASVMAMIQLAPKAIALVPGLLRGAITSKLLFPGASSPGWLMLILAPMYALLLYVVLIVPYQIAGSGTFVPAMIGLIGAQVWLGRTAFQLARPERLEEVLVMVRKLRPTYVALNAIGLLFVGFGLVDLFKQLHVPIWTGFQVLLALLVNILLVTLIATDQIISQLVRDHRLQAMPGVAEARAALARDVARFDEAAPPPAD